MQTSGSDLFHCLNRTVIDQLPVSIAIFDTDMRYVACSRQWLTHYQIPTTEDLTGRAHYEIFPEIPERWKTFHRQALRGEIVRGEEDRFERLDGTVQYDNWELRPWYDDNGAVGGIIALTEDVTETIETRKKLRESELRWKFALEESGDGLWDWNLLTDEVYFSPQWKAMLGFEENEISGSLNEWSQRVRPEQLEGVYADIRAYLDGKTEIYRNEHQVRCKDGSYKWVLDRGVVIERGDDGTPLRMIGTHTDIDASKKLYEQVSMMNRRYTSMFREHDAVMMMFDADTGMILDVNRSAERFYGYSRDQFLKLSVTQINTLPPEQIRNHIAAARSNHQNSFIFHHRLKSGETRTVEVHASPIHTESGTVLFSIIKDITREQANEQELHRTLSKLKQAKKIARLGIWEFDVKNGVLEWSDEIFDIFELDPKRFVPSYEAFFELVHPEDREMVHNAYQNSLKTREEYQITHRLLMPDGRIKHVQEQCDTEFDADGTPLRSIGTLYDVTQMQELADAMRHEKERYENLMKYSSDGIIIMDFEGNVEEVNLTQARMLGYTPEAFKSLSISDWDARFDEAELAELVAGVTEKAVSFETIHRRKDGSTYDAAVTAVKINLNDRSYLYAATRDISEQKRAEEKFRKLLEFASDGIHILDENGHLIYYSRSFAEMLGYGYDELATRNVFDWDASIPPEQLTGAVRALIEVPTIFETRHRRKDGSFYDAQINAKGIELDGRKYLYASARDITAEKQLELEILAERNFVSTIVDTANAVIAVIRPDGTMSRVNRYTEQFTGYTQAEIASEPYFWARFIDPGMHEKVTEIIAMARRGEIVENFQNSWRSKSGEERMFEWSNTLVMQENGAMDYIFTIGIDITEKVEAQKRMLQQKEEFEAIFKTTKDGLAILDLESNFIEFNDAYLEMTGYTRDELSYQSCIGMSVPEDIPRTQAAIAEVIAKGSITNYEKSCYRKDGSLLTINMSIALLPDKQHLLISSRDVTEDRQIRRELIESTMTTQNLLREQASLLSLFDKGDSVLFKWNNDESWSIAYVSDNAERLLGHSKEAFLNGDVTYASCIHPDDLAHVNEEVHAALERHADFFKHDPYRVLTPDGTTKWVLDHTVTQKDAEGRITHFIGYINDITHQKATESDLIRAKENAERLFSYTPIPLGYVSSDGNVLRINQKFIDILGYLPEEIPDVDSWFTLAYPDADYRQWVYKTWNEEVAKAVWEHREIRPREYRVCCKRGETRTMIISGIFVGKDLIVSFYDVTEAKRAQKSLERAKVAAEKANQAKSAFLANMSHEIRTPLNGIIGLTDIVLNSDLEAGQRGYLEKAQQSSHALLGIINDILDYSKIEAGKMDIVPTDFELRSVTKNVSSLFGYQIHEKNLDFRIHIDPAIPAVVNGDALRLTQILNNLVGNSVKFTERGHILLDIASVDAPEGTLMLRFLIEDTGIGISPENLAKLFQAFEQGDQSTTRKFGGSGLGLMITRQLVELMGGTIEVESEEGKGSRFTFTLPFHHDPRAVVKTSKLPETEPLRHKRLMRPKTALLVEDNETNQLVASLLLEEMGFRVEIAGNGLEGIERCRQVDPDIIFMDIQMPVMDGFEASRKIRRFNGTVPIIALSAAVMQRDRELSEAAGMNRHIAKPIDPEGLKGVIADFFELADGTPAIPGDSTAPLHLECADLEAVVDMVNKDPKVVYTMYETFKNSYRATLEILDGDPDASVFKEYVHKLKGVTGNLRIREPYALTQEIEAGNGVTENCSRLKRALHDAFEEIESKITPLLQKTASEGNDDESRRLLAELLADTRQASYIPPEKMEAFIASLGGLIGEAERKKLLELYDSFNYAGMEAHLNAMERVLNGE